MAKLKIGIFEREDVIERLARRFYKMQGCNFPEGQKMMDSNHPQERLCVLMAIAAIEELGGNA